MALFEPKLPEPREKKPRQSRRKNSGRLLVYLAGAIAVFIGFVLIKLDLARTAAGNPPQGGWAEIGMMLIGFVAFCVSMSAKKHRHHREGCCG